MTANNSKSLTKAQERRRLDAGSFVLEERIAEAYEPQWRELIGRMFVAMRDADLTRDMPKPWESDYGSASTD